MYETCNTLNTTCLTPCLIGWSDFYFFDRTEDALNQRSGLILEVQIEIFSSRRATAHAQQSFHFEKIPGGLNINIFCENRHDASFYIKEQTQKTNSKFEF